MPKQSPASGALTGALVTAVIQSSSVTTVLVVGFISAGLMTLTQSVGVILGADIGTTIDWYSFDIGNVALNDGQTYFIRVTSDSLDGKIFVGTNNDLLRDPEVVGDKGVIMAFRESDGEFLWQMVHDKLESGQVNDWPFQGICSSPHVEGDRLYYVSNRGEIVALDTEGFRDGENDGSYTDEERTREHLLDDR